MKKVIGPKETIFIDDSYSANPNGVMAAIEYIKEAYPEYKKVFVFSGIIELGKNSQAIHENIWKEVNECFDIAYLMQTRTKNSRETYDKCDFVFNQSFDSVTKKIQEHFNNKTVILFESRGAGAVMKKILKQK